ncbi:hypothetical protein KP509_07G003900 [Ceratopteris richardii]|uniref:Uncharacterized protein n=1 Tax=Ceratopteris richardii TaxID=49495 RepID=A0A8T2U9F4_CERRI|nr:hypothetical protein KP509_07G003900 [Ceratopteris richardii]
MRACGGRLDPILCRLFSLSLSLVSCLFAACMLCRTRSSTVVSEPWCPQIIELRRTCGVRFFENYLHPNISSSVSIRLDFFFVVVLQIIVNLSREEQKSPGDLPLAFIRQRLRVIRVRPEGHVALTEPHIFWTDGRSFHDFQPQTTAHMILQRDLR